jgi:glycogen(starch) synthase
MTADTVGGVWTYALELARALAPAGVQVALATMGEPVSAVQRREAAQVPGLEVFESEFRLEWMDDPWEDVARAGDWLLGLEARVQPDLVHLNGFAHGCLPWSAPALVVGHSCVLSWWQAVRGWPAPHEWDAYRAAVRAGLQAADAVVAPSRAMLSSLREHYGPLPRATVVPNGRAWAFVDRPKRPLVLAAGRLWDEAKNLALLERVADRVAWPVVVAGEQRHPSGQDRPASGVLALGALSPAELGRWLARAAVYALPARYEPFGLSVLEAALAGCALVLGDIPSLRENWDGRARFVHPDDVEALAAAVNELCGDPGAAAEAGRRARARGLELTPERMAGGYRDLYGRLLGECADERRHACAS